MPRRPARLRDALPAAAGLLLGGAALLLVISCGGEGFVEVEEYREFAPAADAATWRAEYERRAVPWQTFPDPPGTGPVTSARYWIARPAYELEVRRRGDRVTLGVGGVDPQVYGGGWTSFGEGRITGPDGTFDGAVATVHWDCLGIRFRHASDGAARLTFSADGRSLAAVYTAYEAPEEWGKADGRRVEGPRPPWGAVRGQIPYSRAMARLAQGEHAVDVRVVDEAGAPLAGAVVSVKGRPSTRRTTDAEGRARVAFQGSEAPWAVPLCAAAAGRRTVEHVLFAGDPELSPGGPEAVVALPAVPPGDHPAYRWAHAAPDADPDDVMACGTCHGWQYAEWVGSRHARAAENGHVEHMHREMRTYDPLAPDDCRGCHQPAQAVDAPGGGWARRGPAAGVHCDLCHKVAGIEDVERSGVFGALRLARPDPASGARPGGIHHVFGPNVDVTFSYMGASFAPWMTSSELCGGCHQGGGRTDLGVPKIETLGEWRAWARAQGGDAPRSCQDCHMPAGTTRTVTGAVVDQLAWDALHRAPSAVHSHRFPGVEAAFAAPALEVRVEKRRDEATGEWVVRVAVRNVGVGHKVPTGTWTKHVAVGVWARAGGRWLARASGDVARLLPEEPRSDALAAGDWRNPAGMVFRVRPRDPAFGPLSARFWGAWKPEDLVDERLAPGEERAAEARFAGAAPGEVPEVEVQVVHRRGEIGAGPASTPWEILPYDPPPQTLWLRVLR